MITDERTATYIESLNGGNSPLLETIEKEAIAGNVPIIRRASQSFIKVILAGCKPKRVLEIGAAIGFSSILMAEYGGEDIHITTIENYEKRIPIARENITRAGKDKNITLIEGDAMDVLNDLHKEGNVYDMVFIDAAKAQYINYYPLVKDMLVKGGVLISDNILFDGDIIESRFAVRRRDRTIHSRMRQYLRMLSEDKDMVTTILPIGDGMTMSVKEV